MLVVGSRAQSDSEMDILTAVKKRGAVMGIFCSSERERFGKTKETNWLTKATEHHIYKSYSIAEKKITLLTLPL